MTGGLVGQSEHVFLPSVPPVVTMVLTLLSIMVRGFGPVSVKAVLLSWKTTLKLANQNSFLKTFLKERSWRLRHMFASLLWWWWSSSIERWKKWKVSVVPYWWGSETWADVKELTLEMSASFFFSLIPSSHWKIVHPIYGLAPCKVIRNPESR